MAQADRKAVVKNADMSEEMQQDAIDCANQALEKFNIEKDIAVQKHHYSRPSSRRNSIRSTTQPGIASLDGTSDPTSPMRPNISSTSTWAKLPSSSSRAAEKLLHHNIIIIHHLPIPKNVEIVTNILLIYDHEASYLSLSSSLLSISDAVRFAPSIA